MDESKLELKEKIKWFINLRWIATLGVFITITFVHYILNIKLPIFALYLGNLLLLFYNGLFVLYNKQLEKQRDEMLWTTSANKFANIQISTDLFMLTYLIYFSGGIENPFIFYFIFHTIIASILLSNKSAYFQAALSIILLGVVTTLEYLQFIPHYHLQGFISKGHCLKPYYLVGVLSVFITTLYLTVYMATSIVNRLREREKELAIVNQLLQEESKLKSRYVGIVAHDIQSSVSTIQSSLKVVLDGFTGEISEKAKEMIARAEQRSLFLLHFVKDLLSLSRIKIQELKKEQIQLNEVMRKVLEQIKIKVEEKQLKISFQNATDSLIYANSDAMEQLFLNLLHNAVKYTPRGGKINVSSVATNNGCIKVSIEDTGIGIPKEDIDEIFDEFYRAKNAQKFEKDGTGLGLSIVKEIIDAHQGEIWVESEVGKSSKFIFKLPKSEVK